MRAARHERGDDGAYPTRHPDTILVDLLTAFLNRDSEPSGADLMSLLMSLLDESGRPLLAQPTIQLDAEVTQDRYGLDTVTVTGDDFTIRIFQPTSGDLADLRIEVDTGDGDDLGLAITVNGRSVLDPMTCTTGSSVPYALRLNGPDTRR